jgi:adenine phosphoribosyltransferase
MISQLKKLIRDIPDFPKAGILYRDITTLLNDAAGLKLAVEAMVEPFAAEPIDAVIGVEARGFIFGAPMALAMQCGFVPVRKAGKLPAEVIREDYELEYGSSSIEVHRDAVDTGSRVLLVDDVLATGGTMRATCRLVEQLEVSIVAVCFLLELRSLEGRAKLNGYRVESVVQYD